LPRLATDPNLRANAYAHDRCAINLQGTHGIPSQFVQMIPYVLTIIALAGVVGKSTPPAALGGAE